MPELPEVETIRRDLQIKIVGKKITDVLILDKRTVKSSLNGFKKALIGNKIEKIERRGKLLIFELSGKKFLLVHLKMTGQLILVKSLKSKVQSQRVNITVGGHSFENGQKFDLPDKHTRVVIEFSDPSSSSGLRRVNYSKLFFNDMRVFGYMKIVGAKEKERIVKEDFGVDALNCHSERIRQLAEESRNPFLTEKHSLAKRKDKETRWRIKKGSLGFARDDMWKRKTAIKSLLLNQKIIAGIGNIYADEICFCAGVRPSRRVNKLSKEEIKKIFICIPKVLQLAIKHRGTTFNNYVDSDGNKGNFVKLLKVYGRGGLKCKRCGEIIKKIKQGGRGTHFCPRCQG